MFDTSAAGHDFNIDNGTFFVDASADRVGIGTTTPSTLLDVNGVLTATSIAGTLTTAAQTNITSVGTLTSLTVDDITINGSTISDAADLTIDVGNDIILDSDSGVWRFKDAGTTIFQIARDSNSYLNLYSGISDMDMRFQGNDGGSLITALTLDMSAAGTATFNSNIIGGGHLTLPDNGAVRLGAGPDTLFYHDTNHTYLDHTGTGNLKLRAASQVDIQDTDGTTCANFIGGGAVTLYHNNAAKLQTASGGVTVTGVVTSTTLHTQYASNVSVANLAEVDDYSPVRFGDFRADQSDNLYFMSVGGGKVGIQARDDSANGVAKKLSLNPYGGTVGVGIADPSANLEVRGSGANGQFYIGGTTTNTYGKIYSDNDGVLVLAADGGNNAANSYLGLEVDGTERLRINSAGTIATAANGVIESASSAGSLTISGGSTNKGGQILLRGGNGDSDIVFKAQASTATPTERVRINSTGLIIKDSSLEFDKPSVYGFRFLHNDNGNDLSLQIGDANNANYRTLANFDTNGININHLNQDSNMARLRLGRNVQNDSYVYFNTIAQDWSIGVDYSDSSKFKLSRYSSPGGGNNIFEIGTGGDMAYYVHLTPATTNTYDLGTSTVRWRNIFSQDLHLSNEDTGGNDVDGTEGNWTIQEGEEHLYIINNKTGKKFRFALEEVT